MIAELQREVPEIISVYMCELAFPPDQASSRLLNAAGELYRTIGGLARPVNLNLVMD